WLRAVLTRGLALRPAERYTNIDALLTELERRPRALRRRAAASLLSVTVVAGAVLTSQLGAATEPCPREDPQLAALWDAGARARVRAAMEDAAVDVAAALDDYAARWDATRRESCLDAKVRGAQSDARFDRSVACLEVRRAAMAAIIDEFKAPELATTLAAGELLESLPSLAECRDPRYLDATPLVPPDEATARGVDEVRARLRQAENAQLRGSLGEGLALVERARTQAERLGFPPLLAEVSLLHGRLLLAELRVAPGEHALQAAIREADRSGHDDVRWQAQLALGRSALDDREDLSLARERLRDAEATVERLGASTPRRVELRVLEGQLLHAEGQQLRFDERRAAAEQLLDESERILVEAVDAIEPLRDDSPRVYARAAASLADLHADRGDIAAARARYDESFGRHTARDEAVRKFNEAELLVGVGELAAARPLLDEALALDQQHFGPDSPHLAPDYLLLATLEWTAAETAEAAEASEVEVSTSRRKAIQAGERALALYDRHFARDYEERLAALALLSSIYASLASYEDMERVNRAIFDARRETRSLPELWREHNNVGYALIEQGRFVEARNWYQEFRADFDAGPAHALVSIRAYASCGIARALLGLGQLEASLPEFEQALGELDVAAEGDDAILYGPPNATEREALLAEARWFYAQALRAAGRDLERARALARKARGWYQENDPAAADEIDRFLVKSPN
ncbi:MAG: hypothetical protein KC636_26885, partial [Myxococcales bacterium]|nr:hypothetical protein [Myxococcales bacterium]